MNLRLVRDRAARRGFQALTVLCCVLVLPILGGLAIRSGPVLKTQPLWRVLFSSDWSPTQGQFGLLPFLAGTVYVTLLAMLIAVPVSLLTAIFLSEYASRRVCRCVLPLVDVLSGIPSVIYGVWGTLLIVPAVSALAGLGGSYSSGYCLLSGALVLSVMVCPFIIHVAREVLAAVPRGVREASLSLGAGKWQTVKRVVLRRAFPGIVAAVVLGLSRAFGETIAVLMVVGNVPVVPRSLFDPAYPLPALLANNYGEMMSVPLYDSALLFAALALLVMVVAFNLAAKAVLGLARSEAA
ncbi:MAG: phosphate ABC transporter permease subunit PstC [Lentisphaerae bacterium]|nr:phosphate ABC transporter permease subunit PstC [Lentisphaerota bacterium]